MRRGRAMIRSFRDGDDAEWLRMRRALWDDRPDDQRVRELGEFGRRLDAESSP
jgi:hypothetical protein